jgi:hypothetical protein
MEKSGRTRLIVLVASLLLIPLAVLFSLKHWHSTNSPPPEPVNVSEQVQPPARTGLATRVHAASALTEARDEQATNSNPLLLSREKIEQYLALHHRDAASLLAAHHVLFDTAQGKGEIDYLREAATNFPNDPRVQLAVLAQNAFPEDRRQWLDAFKASSPSNSLANYLSARNYFDDNQTEAAIKELTEATGKGEFSNYSMETFLGVEDMFRSSGESSRITATAAMSGMAQDLLPQLSGMKGIANGVKDLQKQYSSAGDAASVQNLSQMNLALANRFSEGDGGRFLIGQLVGMAIESISLDSLDQTTPYDFLGGQTPAEMLAAIKDQRKSLRELVSNSSTGLLTASDADMIAYVDRVKVYGEISAMRWFAEQHPAANPAPAR